MQGLWKLQLSFKSDVSSIYMIIALTFCLKVAQLNFINLDIGTELGTKMKNQNARGVAFVGLYRFACKKEAAARVGRLVLQYNSNNFGKLDNKLYICNMAPRRTPKRLRNSSWITFCGKSYGWCSVSQLLSHSSFPNYLRAKESWYRWQLGFFVIFRLFFHFMVRETQKWQHFGRFVDAIQKPTFTPQTQYSAYIEIYTVK